MSCTRPLVAVDFGIDKDTGKHKIHILPKRIDHNLGYLRSKYGDNLMLLPCGTCIECRKSRSKDWANRCYLESLDYEDKYFITLTYDEKHCPKDLIKKHFQDFVKHLRNDGFKFRYFACGEYGSISLRPHYHLLSFGLCIDDLRLHHREEESSNSYYTSDFISRYWPYGFVLIAKMTPETICYTARYCTKKIGSDDYKKEFILMSRRPGIGFNYLEKHQKEIINDERLYLGEYGVKGYSRYIREYIKKIDPVVYEALCNKHKKSSHDKLISNRLRMHLCEDEILHVSDESSIIRNKRLSRNKI